MIYTHVVIDDILRKANNTIHDICDKLHFLYTLKLWVLKLNARAGNLTKL